MKFCHIQSISKLQKKTKKLSTERSKKFFWIFCPKYPPPPEPKAKNAPDEKKQNTTTGGRTLRGRGAPEHNIDF